MAHGVEHSGWGNIGEPVGLANRPLFLSVPGEMVRQARILAQATSDLVNAIKADAEGETDLENSRKLLSAAKILADATAKMVEAAKVSGIPQPHPMLSAQCCQGDKQPLDEGAVPRARSCTELRMCVMDWGLLLELWVAAENLLALWLLNSPRGALGISPALQAAEPCGSAPQCQTKAQLLLQRVRNPMGPSRCGGFPLSPGSCSPPRQRGAAAAAARGSRGAPHGNQRCSPECHQEEARAQTGGEMLGQRRMELK